MLSPNELAKMVGMTDMRIKQILREKNLPFSRKGKNGSILIPHTTVGLFLQEKKQEIKPEISTFFILKGGTGKTILNVNYSAWLAERSARPILLIDLDGEACASNMLLQSNENLDNLVTIYEILKKRPANKRSCKAFKISKSIYSSRKNEGPKIGKACGRKKP